MKAIKQSLEILDQIKPVLKSEEITLENAQNRVLAKDIFARFDLPAFDNTALDGYAFAYCDKNNPLSVKGSILAGDNAAYEIKANECYKIMTGAHMPKGADTIIQLEDEAFDKEGKLLVKEGIKKHNALRFKAEELASGDLLFASGSRLNPASIALLASQGLFSISVYKQPKIGVYASGDELCEPWQSPKSSQIYNANAYATLSLLKNYNPSYCGIIKDSLNACKSAIEENEYDFLITSGAASVGEADYFEKALDELGFKPYFKGVKMKPGKPIKAYFKDKKIILVLPGNPLPAYLGSLIFAKSIIEKLEGCKESDEGIRLLLKSLPKIKPGRDNIIIGTIQNGFFIPQKQKIGMAFLRPLLENTHYCILNESHKEGSFVSAFSLARF